MSGSREWPLDGDGDLVLVSDANGLRVEDRGRGSAVPLARQRAEVVTLLLKLIAASQQIHNDEVTPLDEGRHPWLRASWNLAPELWLELSHAGGLAIVERRHGQGRVVSIARLGAAADGFGAAADGFAALTELCQALAHVARERPQGDRGAP